MLELSGPLDARGKTSAESTFGIELTLKLNGPFSVIHRIVVTQTLLVHLNLLTCFECRSIIFPGRNFSGFRLLLRFPFFVFIGSQTTNHSENTLRICDMVAFVERAWHTRCYTLKVFDKFCQ